MNRFIDLNIDNIKDEHICCAISDKKCLDSYNAKKEWLANEFSNGYVFRRLDERAKVFIEFGPAEYAWVPISAPNYYNLNCFWVSGKYKKQGYGKALLKSVIDDAKKNKRDGLVTVVGSKKMHFMSDTKWLLRQGFQEIEQTSSGFSLIALNLNKQAATPAFNDSVKTGTCPHKKGLVAYYSNRCPFAEYHVKNTLAETAEQRNIPLKSIKLKTMQEAQKAPSPATIFSLFKDGTFLTTDISACMEKRFDKLLEKIGL